MNKSKTHYLFGMVSTKDTSSDQLGSAFKTLAEAMTGELVSDFLHRVIYSTDASIYREMPLAVATPKTTEDLRLIIEFASTHGISITPRAAGTSLAGQTTGGGLIVDVSRHFTGILELNIEEQWVRVQPGVIRDELNRFLEPHGLFFGPNTSTANRAMIGGMVGNNSSGTTSIRYGVTRDHVLEIKALLSDGSAAVFRDLSEDELLKKLELDTLEGKIYRFAITQLSDNAVRDNIVSSFPDPSIHRRNTGYALDSLVHRKPFKADGLPFSYCPVLTGSEGTLAFVTEVKLSLSPLPPPHQVLVCGHFRSVYESLQATRVAMETQPYACELMDKVILDCTRDSRVYQRDRFFLEGDPEAVLVVELRGHTEEDARQQANKVVQMWRAKNLGYAYPMVFAPDISRVWSLRAAGLGLLSNIPGDSSPVACIEDTAVAIDKLPEYIRDFEELMAHHGQKAVYYAHAGAGELHLRPILNLKNANDRRLFKAITQDSARLVKKYNGSLSGEHGDGRVRAPYIPEMVGSEIYQLFKGLKSVWDPKGIFNPGKITDPLPIDQDLRFSEGQKTPEFETILDFSREGGILRAAEKCNGSADCRKLPSAGGVMCPSYHATRNEKDTTRARANALREFLTHSPQSNPFSHQELKEVMDLCISCKGCTGECPSDVDMAGMKSEFLHQYHKSNRRPLRDYFFAHSAVLNSIAATTPALSRAILSNPLIGSMVKGLLSIAPQRPLPLVSRPLSRWLRKNRHLLQPDSPPIGRVYLFCDEFTNLLDVEVGKSAVRLLVGLGYEVVTTPHPESGRAALSKGFLEKARLLAERHISVFAPLLSDQTPLIGLEPSAILSFRDEYPKLVRGPLKEQATKIASCTLLLEEFLHREVEAGRIRPEQFTQEPAQVLLHGHCHQKALASVNPSAFVLGLPEQYTVEVAQTGCCGMAGSFGYEREHYDISMKIGEQALFPAVTRTPTTTIIAAPGTSCRHQIADGTGRKALHPAEILWQALVKPDVVKQIP